MQKAIAAAQLYTLKVILFTKKSFEKTAFTVDKKTKRKRLL